MKRLLIAIIATISFTACAGAQDTGTAVANQCLATCAECAACVVGTIVGEQQTECSAGDKR